MSYNFTPQPNDAPGLEPTETKVMVKFDEGIDYDFDKAMNSIDDMYADMFNTKPNKSANSGAQNINAMYN